MKFALNQFIAVERGKSRSEKMREWVDVAKTSEDLGFWGCWLTEHHFGSDTTYRPYDVPEGEWSATDYDMSADPLHLLMYLAAETKTLRLGTAVQILQWDHPIRIAERAAMLDLMSGGRLELGVGRGAGYRETKVFNVPKDAQANKERYYEAIEIIRRAWTGEPFELHGNHFDLPRLELTPQPERQPAPIWIGSSSPESAEWAARNGLPYVTITWPLTELHHYKEKWEAYQRTAAEAGTDISDFDIPYILFMYCHEDERVARDTAYHYVRQFAYTNEAHYEHARQDSPGHLGADLAGKMNLDSLDYISRFPAENHIVGTPEQCIERIEWFRENLDVDYIILNNGYGTMPRDMNMRSLELFGEKVLPHFDRPAELVAEGAATA